jgi:hypothetical protein
MLGVVVPLAWISALTLVVVLFGARFKSPMVVGIGLMIGLVAIPILLTFVHRRGTGVGLVAIGSILPVTTVPLVVCQGTGSLSSLDVTIRPSLSYGLWPGPAYQVNMGGCASAMPFLPLLITWLLMATGLVSSEPDEVESVSGQRNSQ